MARYTFSPYDRTRSKEILPQMYDILFMNMSKIAPTGNDYEEDKQTWMSYMASPQGAEARIILMYADETLAGYLQYSIAGDTLLVDEVEIRPEYQRTLLFYRFFRFMINILPKNIAKMRAYINKNNKNSQTIAGKLGMKAVGENASGRSWLYEGEMSALAKYRN